RFKALDNYIAELERELGQAPDSIRTNLRLAEAYQSRDRKKALLVYRKLAQLKPEDSAFQRALATLLQQSNQKEEAVEIWEALLQKAPEEAWRSGINLVDLFKEAGRLQRLAEI